MEREVVGEAMGTEQRNPTHWYSLGSTDISWLLQKDPAELLYGREENKRRTENWTCLESK